ncbi:MAG: phytanoyl-CoA dioxygenase family protein [Gammaproteobacteria bacterium]|nr:phytanoyl-CoA dioxygenase family protein [Gammaproteobacteria bacterium]
MSHSNAGVADRLSGKSGPTTFSLDEPESIAECFHRHGYAVVKNVFNAAEVAALKSATDRAKRRGLQVGKSFRHGNLGYWIKDDPRIGTNVIGMQWPSYQEDALELHRRDPRMATLLEPLIGRNIRQIVNQLHWKTPGSTFAVSFHRDRINRRPAEAFRALATSYVQTATVIDSMNAANGALLVVPGSHLRTPRSEHPGKGNFIAGDVSRAYLSDEGFCEADLLPLHAEPGDVALWHVDTIHGSEMNQSSQDRCLYINGYVDARNCMRGHWAFINGQGIPLPPIDVPVLVHRDDIFDHLAVEFDSTTTRLTD